MIIIDAPLVTPNRNNLLLSPPVSASSLLIPFEAAETLGGCCFTDLVTLVARVRSLCVLRQYDHFTICNSQLN